MSTDEQKEISTADSHPSSSEEDGSKLVPLYYS